MSPKRDLVADLMHEADAAHGQHHLGRQLLVSPQTAVGECVAHRLLDLALRGDTNLLEKLAQACVEDVFVHHGLLIPKASRGNACPHLDPRDDVPTTIRGAETIRRQTIMPY